MNDLVWAALRSFSYNAREYNAAATTSDQVASASINVHISYALYTISVEYDPDRFQWYERCPSA